MVPLTSSLYTFGRLASNEKVLVDVGTGYFVQKVFHESFLSLSYIPFNVFQRIPPLLMLIIQGG